MKVIYVLSSTSKYGGASKSFLNMLHSLRQHNLQPLVIVPDTNGLYEDLHQNHIPTKKLTYRMSVYPPIKSVKDTLLFIPRLIGRIIVNGISSVRLYKIAKDFQADIIHTNVSVTNIGYNASRMLHIPHVWHIREYGALDFHYYYYYYRGQHLRKLQKNNSYSICITKDIAAYNHLTNKPQSCVIYNGILPKNSIQFTQQKQSYFLYAGRLEPTKGIADVLYAYAQFYQQSPATTYRLKIAGDTNNIAYKTELLNLTQKLHIADMVDFLGMRDDVMVLMRDAYAMIVPSHSEGFGRITAEAMFNGALVIGKDTAGTKEQFDNGLAETGKEIGLRYNTQEELVQLLHTIVNQGIEHYFPMIKRSQDVVQQLYSVETYGQKVFAFYQEILHL